MAKSSNFTIDSAAVKNGQWIRVGLDFDDLEIQTRGFTPQFTDARAAKLRRIAFSSYSGDVTRVPTSKFHEVNIECLITHCLLDVRNLVDDAGAPIDFPTFCKLLQEPDYAPLYEGTLRAVGMVGVQREGDMEEAAKN